MLIYAPPEDVQPPAAYVAAGIVRLTTREPALCCRIVSAECACDAPDGIAVHRRTVHIRTLNLWPCGHPCYRLRLSDDPIELETALLWLVKSQYYTVGARFVGKRFERCLQTPYRKYVPKHPCGCFAFTLADAVHVYCLESTVVAGHRSGPSVASVLL